MVKHTHRHGTPLADETRRHLKSLVEKIGEYEAAKAIGIGYPSIARAIAGLGLRKGTVVAIQMKLAQIH